jgi:hypothetical protein
VMCVAVMQLLTYRTCPVDDGVAVTGTAITAPSAVSSRGPVPVVGR